MDNNKLNELKELANRFLGFGKDKPAPASAALKFEAFKVKGSNDQVEVNPELEIGSDVMASSGTGSIPARDGEFELDNGMKFTVKDGKIESVANDGKTPPPVEGDDAKKVAEKMSEVIAAFDVVKAELKAVKEEFAAAKLTIETYSASLPTKEEFQAFSKHLESVGNVVIELSQIPYETLETKQGNGTALTQQEINFSGVAAKFTAEHPAS